MIDNIFLVEYALMGISNYLLNVGTVDVGLFIFNNMSTKPKRPQEVDGVRVRMPDGYDFNTWGNSTYNSQAKIFQIMMQISPSGLMQYGKNNNSRIGSD